MSLVHIDDFQYMWRGQQRERLLEKDIHLLAPIDIRGQEKKRALLLLHGFGSSPAVFRFMLPALTGYDALVCPTLPGHGTNLNAFAAINASDWIAAAEAIGWELYQNYETVEVLGVSLGGLLACHLAKTFPIHHLYLLNPALALQTNLGITRTLAQMLQWLGLKRIPNRAGDLISNAHTELTYRKLPLSTIIEILSLIHNFSFVPPTCPVDLFLGRQDHVVNVSKVESMLSALPNTTTHWLEDSAHVLPLDNDLEKIVHCINTYRVPL